jgi:hypothetical protein
MRLGYDVSRVRLRGRGDQQTRAALQCGSTDVTISDRDADPLPIGRSSAREAYGS